MKRTIIMEIAVLLVAGLLFAQKKAALPSSSPMFLKADQALLATPTGSAIATLLKGVEINPLAEQGGMVKVQFTGWIPKSALAGKPMRALHIALETRATADSALAEIRAGKGFNEVCKNRSKGPAADRGGDLGYFNSGDFEPIIENTIKALGINQVSPIIEASGRFFIFKRIE